MKIQITAWIRAGVKTGVSALIAWLTVRGVEVDPAFFGAVVVTATGAVNTLLNILAEEALTVAPDWLRTVILFVWAPPSYT